MVLGVGVTVGVTRRVNQGGRIAESGVGVRVDVVRRVALGVGVLLGVSVRVAMAVTVRVSVGVAVSVGVVTFVAEGVVERVTVALGVVSMTVGVIVGVSTRVAEVVTVGVSTRVGEIMTVGVIVRVDEMATVGVSVCVAVRAGLAAGCAFTTCTPPASEKLARAITGKVTNTNRIKNSRRSRWAPNIAHLHVEINQVAERRMIQLPGSKKNAYRNFRAIGIRHLTGQLNSTMIVAICQDGCN
jgi:hypothetical protein